MKTVACIIARTNSTRLPIKVLKEISGRKMIEHIIDKMKKVKGLDEIYLCTSVDPDDQILLEIAKENGIKAYAGSRAAVIERMLAVAEIEQATNVIRITGDNIFTDEIFLSKMIEEHNKDPTTDYTRTEFLPLGTTAEVIRVEALKKCYASMDPDKSEYLMLYMFNPDHYNCLVLIPEPELHAKYTSLTVDVPDDWERTVFIMDRVYKDGRVFYHDILKLSGENDIPHFKVNKQMTIKLPDDSEVSFEDFLERRMAARIGKSRKVQLEEGFYVTNAMETVDANVSANVDVNTNLDLNVKVDPDQNLKATNKSPLKIKGVEIGGNRSFIMAEIASSHGGDPELQKTIFRTSVEAGADAVKLQLFNTASLCSKNNPDYEVAKKIEISPEKWRDIFQYVSTFNTITFAEVFDEDSLELAAPFVDGLSVHSTDLTNPDFLKSAAAKNKPIILNLGGSTMEEIKEAIRIVEDTGNHQIILMYGIQNFPTDVAGINLNRLKNLMEQFPYPVGYHDHTDSTHPLAISLSLAARAMGAMILEKHVTDDRSKKGFDYISSLHQEEFSDLVQQVRDLESSFGSSEINLSEGDIIYRKKFKKYIVARQNLTVGTVLKQEHLAFKRIQDHPSALFPMEKDNLLNKRLILDIDEDQVLTEDFIEREY